MQQVSFKVSETGAKGFLQWLQKAQPWLYAKVKGKVPSFVGGLGLTAETAQTGSASATSSWSDTLKNLLTGASAAYLTKTQLDAQKKILDMQLTRAQQGLSPLDIDPSLYGLSGPSVNVGLTGDTQKLLMYGGLGLLGFFLLSRFMK
jgi:hypothetical protein